MCKIIRENLTHTKLADRGKVHQSSVESFVAQSSQPYRAIMMDPPYASPTIEATINAIQASRLVQDGTVLIVGHWPRLTLQEQYGNLQQLTSRRLGDSSFSIYEYIDDQLSTDEAQPA
jgi:16S rRNA (guanine966-N2)-methyltransferase